MPQGMGVQVPPRAFFPSQDSPFSPFAAAAGRVDRYAAIMNLYITENGEVFGPYPEAAVRSMIDTGTYGPGVLVCPEGQTEWKPFHEFSASSDASPGKQPAAEQVFYEAPGVTVTNARFVVGEQTYVMHHITAVKPLRVDPGSGAPVLLLVLGVLLLLFWFFDREALAFVIFGSLLVLTGLAVLLTLKAKRSVVLTTEGGEIRALESADGQVIDKTIDALNAAIVAHR